MFEGKAAVITGGASGIGLAIGTELGRRGANVVLADLDAGALERQTALLSESGVSAIGVHTDVTDRTSVEALADAVSDTFGGADLLFNNAGVATFGPMVSASKADWDFTMGVNFWGVVNGISAFVPRMLTSGSGHIVNTASMSGLIGMEYLGVYCASKFAVVGLSESLRRELAPAGIGVSVLCPMVVDTPINDNSSRMRPAELRNEVAAPPIDADLMGGVITVGEVVDRVLVGIETNAPYILTHPDQGPILDRRARRLADAAAIVTA